MEARRAGAWQEAVKQQEHDLLSAAADGDREAVREELDASAAAQEAATLTAQARGMRS